MMGLEIQVSFSQKNSLKLFNVFGVLFIVSFGISWFHSIWILKATLIPDSVQRVQSKVTLYSCLTLFHYVLVFFSKCNNNKLRFFEKC